MPSARKSDEERRSAVAGIHSRHIVRPRLANAAGLATLDAPDPEQRGRTALLRALHANRPGLAKLLLDLGANALAKDDDGNDRTQWRITC